MTAIAISNVIGSPISGAIMQFMDGVNGWRGWQWLFLLEGIPSVLIGVLVFWLLPNGPRKAPWLTSAEKDLIVQRVEEDHAAKKDLGQKHSLARCIQGRSRLGAGAGVLLRRGVLLRGQLLDADHHPGTGHRQEGSAQGRSGQHDSLGHRRGGDGGQRSPLRQDRRAPLAFGRGTAGRHRRLADALDRRSQRVSSASSGSRW